MGLLSRALSQTRRLRLPSSRRASLTITPLEQSTDSMWRALTSPREISWWWSDDALNVSNREAKNGFDAAAQKASEYVRSHFPRNYYWSGGGGRSRRYARDLSARLSGSGYRQVPAADGTFEIEPTSLAYAIYAANKLSPALSYGALGGAAGYTMLGQ